MRTNRLNRRTFLFLIFDDGYLSHVDTARFLNKMGVRSIFFVSAELGEWQGLPLLATRLCAMRESVEMGHEVSSRPCTRPHHSECSSKQVSHEMSASKVNTREATGMDPFGLAYPYGEADPTSRTVTGAHFGCARELFDDDGQPFDLYDLAVKHFGDKFAFELLKSRREPSSYVIVIHLMSNNSLGYLPRFTKGLDYMYILLIELIRTYLTCGYRDP